MVLNLESGGPLVKGSNMVAVGWDMNTTMTTTVDFTTAYITVDIIIILDSKKKGGGVIRLPSLHSDV